ncbi:MAG TPA: phage holin family protein [Chloroflexota bacterium]|nr:phage holin family protein [Chloroflexota bacterium]
MYLIVRWLITAIALGVAAWLVPGIRVQDQHAGWAVAVTAAVLGLVNAIVRPLLTLLSCPLILLTLGLFLLVINAAMLGLASWLAVTVFGVGFYIDGFWSALVGSIVVSIVSFLLALALPDKQPA